MSASSVLPRSSPPISAPANGSPQRPRTLRTGLVLSLLLLVVGAIPAVTDFGLDGSAWDVVVIIAAVIAPSMAIATLLLVPFAWNGKPGPAWAIALIQMASVPFAIPAFLLFGNGEVPLAAPLSATVGALLNLLAAALVLGGLRHRRTAS
ncbi:MAG: hypothetical protein L0G99_08710 [Propionibacteriales bacterium]|nr:hypothetical protein [Propionibacteriales bacterium]